MYYQILVNGESLGIFGHDEVRNLHLSVGAAEDGVDVFASGVCHVDGENVFFDWLQQSIGPGDSVEIRPTEASEVAEPRKSFVMNRSNRVANDKNVCDFCQKKESESSGFIYIDQHRPSICSDCVELCNEILRGAT